MQIQADQLEFHLKSHLNPFYFLWGDEPLLIQESADKLRSVAFEHGFTERILFSLESEHSFEWDKLTHSCTSYSLFSEKKIVELILHSAQLKDPPFILNNDPAILLLIRAGALTASAKKSNWFKKINQHPNGVLISHETLNKNQFKKWLVKQAYLKGLELSPEVIETLIQQNEGNLLAARQEIEMLYFIYQQPNTISNIHLDQYKQIMALNYQSRFTPFDLQNAILKGDLQRILHVLSVLERSELILILWVISKVIRNLLQLHHKVRHNILLSQAFQKLSIWPSLIPLYTGAMKRLSLPLLNEALHSAQKIDKDFKTGNPAHAFRSLISLCLTLGTP